MAEIETITTVTEIATRIFLPESGAFINAKPEAIIEAIWCSQGNISRASKLLECSHSALWNHIQNNEKLKAYADKVTEYKNDVRADVLEDLAFNKALYGDSTLIWKLLCTYGAKRGYGDKQQLDIKYDMPPHIKTMLESLNCARKAEFSIKSEETSGAKSETTASLKASNEENKPA